MVVVEKELYLDSGEHVGFDTGCGVLADAEGCRLTVLVTATARSG